MVLHYFGKCFVKASVGDEVISFGPISKDGDIKAPSFGADLVVVPSNSPNYNGSANMSYGSKEPLVIDGPGEYESKGTFVRGWSVGEGEKMTTVYSVRFDDINICYLGPLSVTELPADLVEGIGDVDMLFVPTYNDDTLDPAAAHKLASKLGAKIIIPMYHGGSKKSNLKEYLKEAGEDPVKPIDKLTIKRKDIETKEGEVVAIESF